MSQYQLISSYKENVKYKESFNELAKIVFQLDFSDWYERGCWDENYICYSYVDKDQVIANASINKMGVVLGGEEYKAIQIGTVMTHPNYRNKGLSGNLMNHIIQKYEKEYDFLYLFANQTVLNFYPKFGFKSIQESNFSLKSSELFKQHRKSYPPMRLLNTLDSADFNIMERLAKERIPVSSIVGVTNNQHLLMFYFILVFNDAIYYIEDEDTIIIFKHEDKHLHLFDIIGKNRVDIDAILSRISADETETISFYFTPDFKSNDIHTELIKENDATLFVRPLLKELPKHFLLPLTSHA
ncbi:GNAT family N-acetyltransferase [Bacillus sp. FJAT-29790]|uniref:GNAT family N-acetyltransferase n=1 Tax=Bacillus sp. FJAT-29790 TaxID=1895002 RepID=UPI001C23DCE7|nr:GNAT family N-acetyltransferase [Bacillus sp. FJAT-29790]MBU8880964.1 GNAT family N-acetyltransferase [Bacillus sp. FJAT-29790]